jgi:hypothetical protein
MKSLIFESSHPHICITSTPFIPQNGTIMNEVQHFLIRQFVVRKVVHTIELDKYCPPRQTKDHRNTQISHFEIW